MENLLEETKERAILVGLNTAKENIEETEESLNELEKLAETAGALVVGIIMQNRTAPKSSTYIGQGKAIEVKEACENLGANVVIFDDEITGSQIRNLEEIMGVKVIDRSVLILEIFANRAHTKEGKVQVELAQLRYRLSRLVGIGTALSRQGGGIGTRGPGETQLESDRRHILERIRYLEKELNNIRRHRETLRKGRKKNGIPIVALVGYTNAGKSTLMNSLTSSDLFVEDKLFATLDTATRKINVDSRYDILFIDTVGFIRKLPHHLIESFKSTLEEIKEADIILHVVDSSNKDTKKHIDVTNKLLSDLDVLEKPIIMVYNKIDKLDDIYIPERTKADEKVEVSAITKTGIELLVEKIVDILDKEKRNINVLIPYNESRIVSLIHQRGEVLKEDYVKDGVNINLLADKSLYGIVKSYIFRG